MKTRDFFKYIARPLNIFILLCTLVFIIVFLEAISAQIFLSLTQQHNSPKPRSRQWDIHDSGKEFMPDGRVLLVRDEGQIIKIYDVNYTKLWEGKKTDRPKEYKSLDWRQSFRSNIGWQNFIEAQRITPAMSKALEIPIRQDKKIREIWRYLPDDDIFVGYEFKGEKIGYIGTNGFSQSRTENKPFGKFNSLFVYTSKDSENPVLLWQTEKRFFAIDFENRKTEIIIDGGDGRIYGIEAKNWSYDGKEPVDANYRTFVKYNAKDGNINLILNQPDEKLTFKTPKQWDDYLRSSVGITATKDAIFLSHLTTGILIPADYYKSHKVRDKFYKTNPFNKAVDYSTELYKVDKAGNLSLVNKFQWTKPEYIAPAQKDWEYYFGYTSVVSPPMFYVGVKIIQNSPGDINKILPRDNNGMMRGYIVLITTFYPRKLAVCISLSVVMMLIALWHGWSRKNNRLSFALWIILVGLFNVAGLLTYLALNHTTLLKCPACGKKRNLEQPACIHCQAALPLPPASMVKIK
ncbi:MAG: hypothetical protein WC770_03600 [Phycisphaerae bacterium]|jgi:hypothetical protein